jgi:hypothetical protein
LAELARLLTLLDRKEVWFGCGWGFDSFSLLSRACLAVFFMLFSFYSLLRLTSRLSLAYLASK